MSRVLALVVLSALIVPAASARAGGRPAVVVELAAGPYNRIYPIIH